MLQRNLSICYYVVTTCYCCCYFITLFSLLRGLSLRHYYLLLRDLVTVVTNPLLPITSCCQPSSLQMIYNQNNVCVCVCVCVCLFVCVCVLNFGSCHAERKKRNLSTLLPLMNYWVILPNITNIQRLCCKLRSMKVNLECMSVTSRISFCPFLFCGSANEIIKDPQNAF